MTQEQVQQLKKKLNKIFLEREEQIESIIDAFNNRVNVWLYGSTGTAKTALLNAVIEGFGYSVRAVADPTFLYLYLERSNDLEKSRKLFGINANIPTILCLDHPYMLEEYSAFIRNVLDIKHDRPHLSPFSFVVGESLWEVHDERTNWLADYFERQIQFESI